MEQMKGALVGSSLTHKHQTKLERLSSDKHSSLLQKFVNYSYKKIYNIGPCVVPPLLCLILKIFLQFYFTTVDHYSLGTRLDMQSLPRTESILFPF
jgi:hypothetical protein